MSRPTGHRGEVGGQSRGHAGEPLAQSDIGQALGRAIGRGTGQVIGQVVGRALPKLGVIGVEKLAVVGDGLLIRHRNCPLASARFEASSEEPMDSTRRASLTAELPRPSWPGVR